MEDLFGWIMGHPVILMAIVFFVLRILFGGKKGGPEAQARREQLQRERAEALKAIRARNTPDAGSLPDRVREAVAELERHSRPAAESAPRRATTAARRGRDITTSASAERPLPSPSRSPMPVRSAEPLRSIDQEMPAGDRDPFAFRSLGVQRPTRDYDLDPGAFDFRAPIAEPTEQAFHLKGFSGFHSARGLTGNERQSAAGSDVYDEQSRFDAIQETLGDLDSIRRAIIISEILGRPKALRR